MNDVMNGVFARPALVGAAGHYFTGEDNLRLTSWNSVASAVVTLTGRFLHVDGHIEPFSGRHVPNTDRTAATSTFRRAEGWLLDLSVSVSGATLIRGQTFVRVDVVRGLGTSDDVLSTLLRGYVTSGQRLGWPGSPQEDPLDGQGALRSVAGTNPAAGAEISETVPTGARWCVLAFFAELVTDAAAANRLVRVTLDDGTTVYYRTGSAFTHTASLTIGYASGTIGAQLEASGSTALCPLPVGHRLLAGHRIRTTTTALQAGDNWGAPQMLVEEWLEATA